MKLRATVARREGGDSLSFLRTVSPVPALARPWFDPRAGAICLVALMVLTVAGTLPAQRWHAANTGRTGGVHTQPLEDLAHMSWTRRDGAPSDIAALAQTRDGYLWIGSSFGLFRFDAGGGPE
jgi:ligand-binding sensor domain-containing protein